MSSALSDADLESFSLISRGAAGQKDVNGSTMWPNLASEIYSDYKYPLKLTPTGQPPEIN